MKRFIVTESFWEIFPEAEIAVVLAKGIDNSEEGNEERRPAIIEFLEECNADAKKFLTAEVFSQNPVVAVWRNAYQRFKTKKGVRSSVEALLKRVDKGAGVDPIGPLVDIYNAVSLRFGLPCGGEDTDRFVGDLLLTAATGEENFLGIGDEAYETALPGEIVYKDDEEIVCRCLNWRDSQRTMLTEDTVNAFLVMESVDPERSGTLREAAETLADRIEKFLGGRTEIVYLDADRRETAIA
ncbi:MAG: B3/4 domain-containing protein [Clostridiales Family XIII bacterium]|jgi:DNA/RNA-binding domain of Phe-tRNA-synthetase-like protein|nr:B3/4 domain-containing protein [Clostridiales Family XIII bacterium]